MDQMYSKQNIPSYDEDEYSCDEREVEESDYESESETEYDETMTNRDYEILAQESRTLVSDKARDSVETIGMMTLSKKSASPKPVQLTSASSPWKTQGQMRVSLRATQDKIDANREMEEIKNRHKQIVEERTKKMEEDRKVIMEKQE